MRFYFVVAFLALVAGVFAKPDVQVCRQHNPDITQAINNFCAWTWDLTIPSWKAHSGAASKNNKIIVRAMGNCNPAQWVPQKYCLNQFLKVCANSVKAGRQGTGIGYFGRNNCQKFMIAQGW